MKLTKEEFIESIKQDLGMVESNKEAIPELKDDIVEKENNDKRNV